MIVRDKLQLDDVRSIVEEKHQISISEEVRNNIRHIAMELAVFFEVEKRTAEITKTREKAIINRKIGY